MEPPLEVAPGLYRLPIPIPHSPLGAMNAYAVVAADGPRLVDCGWNTPEAYAALSAGLQALGIGIGDLRAILVTHVHPDHFGLAGRLAAESGAPLLMHRQEALVIGTRYQDARALVEEMEAWLRTNGIPPGELQSMAEASLWMLSLVTARKPDVLLDGGETFIWGRYRFEALWTPGHSSGLLCLYDREARVFLSSDHVLPRISPHVGLHAQSRGDPLGDYLRALKRVRDLPVDTVLPGHGDPFHDLAGRVDAIVAHHNRRFEEMIAAIGRDAETAHTVASRLAWRGSRQGWERLSPFERRMAVTETVAHLEHLHLQGRLDKRVDHGLALYRQPS